MRFFFIALILFSQFCFARGIQGSSQRPFYTCIDSDRSFCKILPYSKTKLSLLINKNQLQRSLQKVYDNLYSFAFHFMGHDVDFFHGHFLYNENFRGILYHTQELVTFYEKQNSDSTFPYLDSDKRNWLQVLKDDRLLDAKVYLSTEGRHSMQFKIFRDSKTITEEMLDVQSLTGSQKKLSSHQFLFYKISCPVTPSNQNNIVTIQGLKETFCMVIH